VAEFLSAEWLSELDAAARSASAPADLRLVVQQVVVDDDGAELASYAVRIADGAVQVTPGRADDADVTFTQDQATAAAIARGELAAQRAFLDGHLRVGGDLTRVLDGARQLLGLVDVFGAARTGTTW
jgi:putative sterol carrier protein